MGDDLNEDLELRPSYSVPQSFQQSPCYNCCKSDNNFIGNSRLEKNLETLNNINKTIIECYKKYGQGEGPVLDSICNAFGQEDDNHSLTNSELDKLELKIFKNISQEFQIRKDNTDVESRKFNVKLFKMTVQAIFDNYNESLNEYELLKKRFHEILDKNEEDVIVDIGSFLTDIIQNLLSSDNSGTTVSKCSCEKSHIKQKKKEAKEEILEVKSPNQRRNVFCGPSSTRFSSNSSADRLVEKFKKDNYMTDSVNTTSKSDSSRDKVLNIFYLLCSPYVQVHMDDRERLSEMYIKDPSIPIGDDKNVTSAEDLRKIASKRKEIKQYVELDRYFHEDREIPVRVSFAKKNIHLNEDFDAESESEKSLIARICSFLCRKFRKC